jgi:hypothetical protein
VAFEGVIAARNVTACPVFDGFGVDVSTVVLVARLTVCARLPELEAKVLSPLYTATKSWLPTASADVGIEATPFTTLPVPNGFAPSRNCTEPVALGGDTVAVSVTVCPKVEGFGAEVRLVEVESRFTT